MAVIPVILVTHGGWGQGLLELALFLLGEQERLTHVALNLDESPEGLGDKLEAALAALDAARALFLVDLRGGTPWNVVAVLTRRRDAQCVAGLNLPMLLEVLLQRDTASLEELATVATRAGREGVVNLIDLLPRTPAGSNAPRPEHEEES